MGIYIISRDVYQQAENGLWTNKVRREYLRVTKCGRYVWHYDLQRSSELTETKSSIIIHNLRRVVRPQFSYHKHWLFD